MTTKTTSRSKIKDVSETLGKVEDVKGTKIMDEGQEILIPENRYFMMGDNRGNSVDSRSLGFVERQDIVGKIAFEY